MTDGDRDDTVAEGENPDAGDRYLNEDQPGVINTLSDTARNFLADPETDTVAGSDLPDDASGEEPPQDGDPGR